MYPKTFFENLFLPNLVDDLQSKGEETLFVCMPFYNSKEKLEKIENVCGRLKLKVKTSESDKNSNLILTKVLDGIAHSTLLLFDLSIDGKYNQKTFCEICKETKDNEDNCIHERKIVNHNVLYELGIAQVIRNPEKIIIIKDKNKKGDYPVDIEGMNYEPWDSKKENFEKWLEKILLEALKSKNFYSDKLVRSTTKLLDAGCLFIIKQYNNRSGEGNFIPNKDERQHFKDQNLGEIEISISRLLELGLLYATRNFPQNSINFDVSYRWTNFGKQIIEYILSNENH